MLNKNNGKHNIMKKDILNVIENVNKSKTHKMKKSQIMFKNKVE